MKAKYYLAFFILLLIPINFVSLYYNQNLISSSKGDRYYFRLQRWYYLAQNQLWSQALRLEDNLDPLDIQYYKYYHQPQELTKNLANLYNQEKKNQYDWLEIAKIESQLGHLDKATEALKNARKIDPLNTDIDRFYFTFLRLLSP